VLLTEGAEAHLSRMLNDLGKAARASVHSGAPVGTLLFILSASEFLSLYYQGSRRPAGDRGTRAFNRFLCRFFPRFNHDARNPQGRYFRIRIPLLREGGKAQNRMKLPAALIHLFRRGFIEDLVAPSGSDSRCVVIPAGRWGFQIRINVFHEDFQHTLEQYGASVRSEPQVAQCFQRRFQHLYGWTAH
jgi:hypothetical protein